MGIFGKVFKGIGKVFKKVGKFIKKGFAKVGKFMDKFGIIGQIGMMMLTSGMASMAMNGLKMLGTNFMSGLANAGWTVGGQAASGAISGAARVAHGVLEGVSKIAMAPVKVVGTITDQVVGAVTDVAASFGKSMGMNLQSTATFDTIFSRAATRLSDGTKSIGNVFGDIGKMGGDVLSGTYAPNYQPIDELGTVRNIAYSSEDAALASAEKIRTQQINSVINRQSSIDVQKGLSDFMEQENEKLRLERGRQVFGSDFKQGPTEDVTTAFKSKIYDTASSSLLADVKKVKSESLLGSAVEGFVANEVGRMLVPAEVPSWGVVPPVSDTPGIVAQVDAISGVGKAVPASYLVEGLPPVSQDDWGPFYKNASEKFGFGIPSNQNRSFGIG